jgi:hypothetical protein
MFKTLIGPLQLLFRDLALGDIDEGTHKAYGFPVFIFHHACGELQCKEFAVFPLGDDLAEPVARLINNLENPGSLFLGLGKREGGFTNDL